MSAEKYNVFISRDFQIFLWHESSEYPLKEKDEYKKIGEAVLKETNKEFTSDKDGVGVGSIVHTVSGSTKEVVSIKIIIK